MIQVENSEKAALPPPSYSPTGASAQPSGSSGYPPNFQSSTPTGMQTGPMPAMYAAQSTPSPMVTPGAIQVPPQPQQAAVLPGNLEAQLGSQYQSQLFARCARGEHDVEKKYGPCGIITAVFLFPIGLIALFMDVQRKCSRCGVRLP